MVELSLVGYVMSGMRPYWRAPVKHADGFTAGIADLSGWIRGPGTVWIELKALNQWPKRAETPVRFGLEALQKDFLWERRGWLLCRAVREYFLFDHMTQQYVDGEQATQDWLRRHATRVWTRSIDWKEFAQCVGQRYD